MRIISSCILASFAALTLPGCSNNAVAYRDFTGNERGVPELRMDAATCQQSADSDYRTQIVTGPNSNAGLALATLGTALIVQQNTFEQCMTARGWEESQRPAGNPICPGVGFLTPTATLSVLRPGSDGHDPTALMLAGRMRGIQGKCQWGRVTGTVEATVTVSAELNRAPAMQGNEGSVPIYVAVTEGARILDKHVYILNATFPSHAERVTISTPEIFMVLPVNSTKSAAAYSILAGFQLTPEQLEQSVSRAAP
jgi:hypothetical protein